MTGLDGIPISENHEIIYPKVDTACDFDPLKICFQYSLQLPAEISEALVLNQITDAIRLWTDATGGQLVAQYWGVSSAVGIPYRRNPPPEESIVLDEFENPIIDGPILISFDPPAEVEFSEDEFSKAHYYVIPNLATGEGRMVWAGIYLNPAKNPLLGCRVGQDSCFTLTGQSGLSLRALVIYEMGKVLGLAPASLADSLMFPVQGSGGGKSFSVLRSHELSLIRSLYPGGAGAIPGGKITGEIIDGDSGSPWTGAHVALLPLADLPTFISSRDVSLFKHSAIAGPDGAFSFENIPVGSYVVLAESMDTDGLAGRLFGEWTRHFAREDYFPPDFYDGGGRESNYEPAVYSPRSALLAAGVNVVAGAQTEPVVVVTEATSLGQELLEAIGSNNEQLSSTELEDLEEAIKTSIQTELDAGSGGESSGGCFMSSASSKLDGSWLFLFAMLLGVLCLWRVRIRESLEISPTLHRLERRPSLQNRRDV